MIHSSWENIYFLKMAISLLIKLKSYIASGNKTVFQKEIKQSVFKSVKKGVYSLSWWTNKQMHKSREIDKL